MQYLKYFCYGKVSDEGQGHCIVLIRVAPGQGIMLWILLRYQD
jgi:hypothetical protein